MWQRIKNIYHFINALLAVLWYRFPARHLTVIGVTGTDGKTTTSTLIYHLLATSGYRVALISTVAAYIGQHRLDTGFHVTSPDPWSLQRLLLRIKNQNFNFVVIEATSHGLDQHRLLGTNIQIGVLTNITHDHLDYHHNYNHYLRAKAKLFAHTHTAILNQNDPSYSQLKSIIRPSVRIIPYHLYSLNSTLRSHISKVFPQEYNQLNAAAAVLTVQSLGLKDHHIIKALPQFPGVPGRMESIPNRKFLKAFIDFAHTPNALKNALTFLNKIKGKHNLIAVFGAAGLRDRSKRPLMGKIASELADYVVLTAEDPRTENVWSILDQLTQAITKNRGHVFKIPDRSQAIHFAVKIAKKGDTIVVLGKGHEQSMCYGTTELPWSDHQQLKTALE